MIKILIIAGFIAAIFAAITYFAGSREKRHYNNGYCVLCGHKLRLFDTTSNGDRGYICDNCNHHVWVSYNWVDKA